MNKPIRTLHDALAYELQGLLYAEKKIRAELKNCIHHITSAELTKAIQTYADNTDNVELRLDRVFNYLMFEPTPRKNEVVNQMIDETQHLLTYTSSPHLKDVLMIACVKNLNAYMTSSLQTAYLITIEMELDSPADLLQQILEWELAVGKRLSTLSIHEFNKLNSPVRAN